MERRTLEGTCTCTCTCIEERGNTLYIVHVRVGLPFVPASDLTCVQLVFKTCACTCTCTCTFVFHKGIHVQCTCSSLNRPIQANIVLYFNLLITILSIPPTLSILINI